MADTKCDKILPELVRMVEAHVLVYEMS